MLKKYCDIIGVNIPEKECKELQSEKLDDCKGCESVLEDVKRITPKPLKVKSMGEKNIIGQKEPVCGGCGKKASEVAKFNPKTKTCNACYQKEYRIKKGPRIRKIKKKRDTLQLEERWIAEPSTPTLPLSFKEGEEIKGVLLNTEQTITIDFSKHPERYKELMTLAANEMRTPEMQVLYLLTKGDFSGLSHKV